MCAHHDRLAGGAGSLRAAFIASVAAAAIACLSTASAHHAGLHQRALHRGGHCGACGGSARQVIAQGSDEDGSDAFWPRRGGKCRDAGWQEIVTSSRLYEFVKRLRRLIARITTRKGAQSVHRASGTAVRVSARRQRSAAARDAAAPVGALPVAAGPDHPGATPRMHHPAGDARWRPACQRCGGGGGTLVSSMYLPHEYIASHVGSALSVMLDGARHPCAAWHCSAECGRMRAVAYAHALQARALMHAHTPPVCGADECSLT